MVRQSVFQNPPDPTAVRRLVDFCHRLARVYICREARNTKYSLVAHFGLSIDDLALDCIADLFERSDDGQFVQLVEYLDGSGWETMSKNELRCALRRLVFSKVNDGFFRRHREADPNLARIIRNVKLAVRSHATLRLKRHLGDRWLFTVTKGDASTDLPKAPPSVLKNYLVTWMNGTSNIPHTVEALCAFADDHPDYMPGYPLTQFAQLVQTAFVHLHPETNGTESTNVMAELNREDTLAVIKQVVQTVKKDMYDSYVGRGKVSEETFKAYFFAIENLLVSRYVEPNREEPSFYEALQDHLPDLEHDAYRSEHRHRFEYLVKKMRPIFLNEMKRAHYAEEI